MSSAGAVALDEGNDRLVGHVEREVGVDRDLLPAFGHLDVLVHGGRGLRVVRSSLESEILVYAVNTLRRGAVACSAAGELLSGRRAAGDIARCGRRRAVCGPTAAAGPRHRNAACPMSNHGAQASRWHSVRLPRCCPPAARASPLHLSWRRAVGQLDAQQLVSEGHGPAPHAARTNRRTCSRCDRTPGSPPPRAPGWRRRSAARSRCGTRAARRRASVPARPSGTKRHVPSNTENGPSTSCTWTSSSRRCRLRVVKAWRTPPLASVRRAVIPASSRLQYLGTRAPGQERRIVLDRHHQFVHLARRVPQQHRLLDLLHPSLPTTLHAVHDARRECPSAKCPVFHCGCSCLSASLVRSAHRGRRHPAGAHGGAVGALRRLRCGARPGVAPHNSLRSLRSLRSDRCGESVHEARCARRPQPCAPRRPTNRPCRVPSAAKSTWGGARWQTTAVSAKARPGRWQRACGAPRSTGLVARARKRASSTDLSHPV